MWLPNRTTIAEYRKTLDKLTTIVNESGKLYWGHSEKPLKPQGVDKLKNCCDKILKQDNSKIPKIKIAFSDGLFNKRMIIYGTKKIK